MTIRVSFAAHNIYLESYKEWLSQQPIAQNTQRVYYSRIKQFLLFREYVQIIDQPLSDLKTTNEAISLYLNFLKQSKSKVKSINANIDALQNFSCFLGLNISNLKRERYYHKPAKVLRAKEQEKFLLAIRSEKSARDIALCMVLLYTGLRISDCARLDVSDVLIPADANDDHKSSENKCGPNNTVACLSFKKNASAHFTKIPLSITTALALKRWLKEREKLAVNSRQTALWLTNKAERLSVSGITFVIRRIGWQAQLVVSAEILRRTWLAGAIDQLSQNELADKCGGYISATTVKRSGIILPEQK